MRDDLLERIAFALERIADAAEQMTPLPEPEPAQEEGCQHPDELRVSLASAGSPDRFYCKACEEYIN